MKTIYGALELTGFQLESTDQIAGNTELRRRLRSQISKVTPVVVAFFICPRAEAERYREGAESLIYKVFFQEEVEDCIEFPAGASTSCPPGRPGGHGFSRRTCRVVVASAD